MNTNKHKKILFQWVYKMDKVAVIGLGNISSRHRRNLRLLYPQAKIFVMSASGRIPKEKINDCDYLVTDIVEIIKNKVQLAIIASPATLHTKHAVPLIKAGIPTLIEKPVSTTVEDADIIKNAIVQYNTPVAIGYCLRYLPSALHIQELLEQKKIGYLHNAFIEIGQYLPDWRPLKDYRECVSAQAHLGGGALFELSHELDYCQWLLGDLSVLHAVLRSSEELNLDVEDTVDILALNKDNTVVSIHLDFLQRQAYRKCRFIGSKGALEWDLIKNEITLSNTDGIEMIYSEPSWDKNQMYLNMIRDFQSLIEKSKHQTICITDALKTVSLIDTIKKQYPITKIS